LQEGKKGEKLDRDRRQRKKFPKVQKEGGEGRCPPGGKVNFRLRWKGGEKKGRVFH